MRVAVDSLCMGCMEVKTDGRCPNPQSCGWIEGSGNESELQLQPRTMLNHKYLIGKVLGQGGFGITYMSCRIEDGRKLAVKEYFPQSFATRTTDRQTVTHSSLDNRNPYQYGLAKFTQEAKTLERLRGHANIVSVIDFFPANNTAYIAMEYLDGITLETYLRKQPEGKISFDQTLQILIPVMDALREVHAANLAHRDVSPDNIILTKVGKIKLIDFGAAKQSVQGQSTQQLILKHGYTPEEQYRSQGVAGPYTDVYAIAATLYRCITGVAPPEATARLSVDTLIPPSELGAKLPPEAEIAILRALQVRARDRYQSIPDLQEALRAVPAKSQIRGEEPQPASPDRLLTTFRVCWIIGSVSMFGGSFLDAKAKASLLVIGIVALAIGGWSISGLASSRRGVPNGLPSILPLMLLAFIGCSVIAVFPLPVSPWGAILLVPGFFAGRPFVLTKSRKTGPESSVPPKERASSFAVWWHAAVPFALLSRKSKAPSRPPEPSSKLALRFSAGEEVNETVDLSRDPITIGRDPLLANLIIQSPHVSGAHAKVWNDSGGVRVEDLKSRNGTYVRRLGENRSWERLLRQEILFAGDAFCLSEEKTAVFHIIEL